jgi:8-oxo-dGTP pyrophosphatase MutT (NUDIX family)
LISKAETLELIESFDADGDDLAAKSRELILGLLRHSEDPFSKRQFDPGHITCTAVVLSPDLTRVLLMHHHRHLRWLLPGGHVEEEDLTLAVTARREAHEETGVLIEASTNGRLVGMDVHCIPARKREPFHLHHDLIFALTSQSDHFTFTEEAPKITWCRPSEFDHYEVVPSIARSVWRAQQILARANQLALPIHGSPA